MKLSIIIPVFNEEKTIQKIIRKIESVTIPKVTKEIIIVDDGSSDNTVDEIKSCLLEDKKIKFIKHKENQGKGMAVRTGIKNSTGNYILIQDADLEYDPIHISKLLEPIQSKKTEVVYGTRLKRPPHLFREERNPLFLLHYLGNRFLSLLTSVLYGQWITDMETGYKVFSKKAVDKMVLNAQSFDFEPEITAKLLKKGYSIVEVPISTNPRGYGEGKKLNTARDGIIAFWTLLKYRFVD